MNTVILIFPPAMVPATDVPEAVETVGLLDNKDSNHATTLSTVISYLMIVSRMYSVMYLFCYKLLHSCFLANQGNMWVLIGA